MPLRLRKLDRPVLKPGKLPNRILSELLEDVNQSRSDPRLIVGPGVGEDAAHIDFGDSVLIAKTDPITFAANDIARYAVNVNANDIAVAGGTPKWFLATLLMPTGSTDAEVAHIFRQLRQAAQEIGVTLAGGHTEVTQAVTQPVICGFMLGEAPAGASISASAAETGDAILLTKGIAIEGTAILARDAKADLLDAGVAPETVQRAADFLMNPGISVVTDAQALISSGTVHAMHDITEGGISTAALELATASNLDIRLERGEVLVWPETAAICGALGLNPWGLIGSGALLAAVDPAEAGVAVDQLKRAGVAASVIGSASLPQDPNNPSVTIVDDRGEVSPLETFERDELARYFDADAG